MSHKLHSIEFTSLTSESWDSLPNPQKLRKQLALAVLAHSELTEEALGLYAPPTEIKEVSITAAALDQIMCMWHGHRRGGQMSPPAIPLKYFVSGFGQEDRRTWASIEVFPGLDSWDVE